MNSRARLWLSRLLLAGAVGAPLGVGPASAAEKVKSDLISPDKRRVTVEVAQQLTRPPEPAALPADLAQPFNPTGFDLPDPAQLPPAAAPGPAAGTGTGGTKAAGRDATGGAVQAAPVASEREILENLVAKIPATGTMAVGSNRMLTFKGSGPVRIGGHFFVTSDGQTYDLELIAVDATNFTVRYRNEEVTRPITPGKK